MKKIWKNPPKVKIYEALGTLGDDRIELVGKNGAIVHSSSGNKFYEVSYDPENHEIMTNDNGSYWQEYLGYPAIAFLMKTGVIDFDNKWTGVLRGISWKDINTKFKNDFNRTINFVHELIKEKGLDVEEFNYEIDRISIKVGELKLGFLGKKKKPPEGY